MGERVLQVRGAYHFGCSKLLFASLMNHSALAFSLTPNFLRVTDLFSDKPGTEPQCDQRCVRRQAHMSCPTAALEEALRRTEKGAGRGQSSSAGESET